MQKYGTFYEGMCVRVWCDLPYDGGWRTGFVPARAHFTAIDRISSAHSGAPPNHTTHDCLAVINRVIG